MPVKKEHLDNMFDDETQQKMREVLEKAYCTLDSNSCTFDNAQRCKMSPEDLADQHQIDRAVWKVIELDEILGLKTFEGKRINSPKDRD